MSKERIQYVDASIIQRLLAIIIDVIVVAIIAILLQFGTELEYEILWKKLLDLDFTVEEIRILVILWFVLSYPIYYVLASSFTDGQTVGKIILKLKVVLDDNSTTKKMFKLHLKRFFFLKGGTKVVTEHDEAVEGLL